MMKPPTQKLQSSNTHWFLFALFPFFAGITAIRNYKAPWAKNVVWAFVAFYGFTFAIGKESLISNNESDIVRYILSFKSLYAKEFTYDQALAFFKDSGEADILQSVISILLSRITDSGQVLTAVYGLIFGFFLSRNLWYIIDRLKGRMKWITILLLTVFFLVNPIWNINGFRFNTAAHIYLYGLLPFLFEGKRKGILVASLSILVHFTFLLPVAVLLLYIAIGNRMNIYFVFFVASSFISNINIGEFNTLIESNVPEVFVERTKNYRNEDKVNQYRQEDEEDETTEIIARGSSTGPTQNWYVVYYLKGLYNSLTLILVTLYIIGGKAIRKNKGLFRGYCFVLLFFAISNIMSSLPSGARFLMIASLLALVAIIFYLNDHPHEKYVNNMLIITSPALILFALVSLRTGLYSISINTVIGNPFLSVFTDYNISLNDLIK